MATLLTIVFYTAAAVALAGAFVAAVAESRDRRALGLAILGVGLAGLDLVLSAGLVAALVLVCYLALAAMFVSGRQRSALLESNQGVARRWTSPVAAAVLLAMLLYVAFRGAFPSGPFTGDALGMAGLGRLVFGRDLLATLAEIALFLAVVVGAGWTWRERRG